MDLKKMLAPFAVIASLAPLAAFADDTSNNFGATANIQVQVTDAQYDAQYYRQPMPPTYQNQGHYELRTVQRWVPGQHEQVWVPEQCVTRQKPWGTKVRCRPGFYDSRWVPGHYVTVQEQVWVPHNTPHPQRYGRQYRGGRNRYGYQDRGYQDRGGYQERYEAPGNYATPVR